MSTSKTSIVLLNNSRETFTPSVSGAISTCVWQLAQAFKARGTIVRVLTNATAATPYAWPDIKFLPAQRVLPGRLQKAQRAGRRVSGWGHITQRQYMRAAVKEIRACGADIVVCNNDPEIASRLAVELPGVQIIHWFHNLQYTSDSFRRQYRQSRAITTVAVSRYLARAVEMAYELDPRSVDVVYPGVDHHQFAARASEAPARPPVLGFLGRLCVEKAPDVMLQAALILASERQDFAVQIIGDTNWGFSVANPYRYEVEGLVEKLRAAGIAVVMRGHLVRAQLSAGLAESDIHVVPSRWDEPFGLTVVEGMAAGLPVVASMSGGIPEIVQSAGLMVPRENPEVLAHCFEQLLNDHPLRLDLGMQSRKRSRAFTWNETSAQLAQAVGLNGLKSSED